MIRTNAVLLALMCTLAGCSGATTQGGTRRSANLITASELSQPAIAVLDAYDAIQRLRPVWLRQRGATSVAAMNDRLPAVMVNEAFQTLDALRGIRATDVTEMEYVSATDATTRYGTGYTNGLIKVRTGSHPGPG